MARTMTVDLGDELREFIESTIESGNYRTQSEVIRESLRPLREKQARRQPVKAVKITPKDNQDLGDIWFYGYHHFGEEIYQSYILYFPDTG